MHRIRILIADDHAILREGIRALLAPEGDMEVVGEASDGNEAVRKCRELVGRIGAARGVRRQRRAEALRASSG